MDELLSYILEEDEIFWEPGVAYDDAKPVSFFSSGVAIKNEFTF